MILLSHKEANLSCGRKHERTHFSTFCTFSLNEANLVSVLCTYRVLIPLQSGPSRTFPGGALFFARPPSHSDFLAFSILLRPVVLWLARRDQSITPASTADNSSTHTRPPTNNELLLTDRMTDGPTTNFVRTYNFQRMLIEN